MERCCLETVDILGAINEYCENQKFHTIIIANQEKMRGSKQITAVPIEVEIDTVKNEDNTNTPQRIAGKIKCKSQKILTNCLTMKLKKNYTSNRSVYT